MRVFDNNIREHAATYMNRVPLCTVVSPSHEFIIIAFYDDGAGLVAVLGYKDQDLIQSGTCTTPDPGYQWESEKLTGRHHKQEPGGKPFPSR